MRAITICPVYFMGFLNNTHICANCKGSDSVRYTRYEESRTDPSSCDWMVGHNCWAKAYRVSELWYWLFTQTLTTSLKDRVDHT